MTEQEWTTTSDTWRMLHAIPPAAVSDRKARLLNAAACRRFWRRLPYPSQDVLCESERLADGLAAVTPEELCWRANRAVPRSTLSPSSRVRRESAKAVCYPVLSGELFAAIGLLQEVEPGEKGPQADIIRDVFGTPFRPVEFDPDWRTSTAVALAKRMYDDRDFDALPVLADALQDAGCEHPDVLGHCRGGGEHVRGCWVVDLVLSKDR